MTPLPADDEREPRGDPPGVWPADRPADWAARPPARDNARTVEILMVAAALLVIALAVFLTQRYVNTPPDTARAPLPVVDAGLPPPDLLADPVPMASDGPPLDASSEAAAAGSGAALPPPPPPSAVLAPDNDAVFAPPPPTPAASAPAEKRGRGPVLIFDAGAQASEPAQGAGEAPEVSIMVAPGDRPAAAAPVRVDPARPMLTRGTLIPAILESAIDPARPGGVRAMVSTDVRSADGRRLLVPRSSRLVGQYRADPRRGEAHVVWNRIERPDGSRVPLGPAAAGGRDGAARLVSQVSAGGAVPARGAARFRPGEPIRVIAARDVDLGEVRR